MIQSHKWPKYMWFYGSHFSIASFWLVENVLEKAYAAETCMTYLWYKLISLLSASDWLKLYWQKLMQQERVGGIRGISYLLFVVMTKVEYIQRGFCTDKYFLSLKNFHLLEYFAVSTYLFFQVWTLILSVYLSWNFPFWSR